MFELIIVESIIGIFLFLHILRPYVKAFWEADGFAFFPLAALFCCTAMIPAYGIRPECFPLFLFSLIYSVWHFPSVAAVFSRSKYYPARDNALMLSFMAAALLAFSLGTAFLFLPYDETPVDNTQKIQLTISDPVRGIDLFVSYYQSKGSDLVLVIPPVTIPLSLIEETCAVFNETGYKVLAFSRPYFDNSAVDQNGKAVEIPIFEKIKRYAQAINGIQNKNMVEDQISVAAEREADIRFLLSALKTDGLLRDTVLLDENPYYENIFLLGYGAGGAASIRLAGDKNFLRMNPVVKAAAAIESVVLCDFLDRPNEPGANWRQNIGNTFKEIFQKPIPRLENISHPEIPVLFIAGDGAQQKNSYRRYMAVVQTMIESGAPFLFASINGVHAIDFSSIPQKYPVLPFLLRAKKEGAWLREEAVTKASGYIAAFFSHVKENPSLAYLQSNLAMPKVVLLETSRQK
ncbi:MAG: hypothetical protein LBG27_02350 [Spirochaetaceae bacterium]|jgi:hypothetical protein|nr:hypothetical protein [Spirochaetaceae bacterium]